MHRFAGHVFDSYDDPKGEVLRSLVKEASALPDFVKTASRLTQEQIDTMPDDNFALVMLDNGAKMKKFAMIDEGNTALSVMYLLKQAHKLPPEAVKVAAANLMHACAHHGMQIPEHLKVAAATGISPVSGTSQKPYAKGAKVIKLNFPLAESPKESVERLRLGQDTKDTDLEQRANMGSNSGTNFMVFPKVTVKEEQDTSKTASAMDVRTRQQATRYVDVTGWDPSAAEVETKQEPSHTLLNGKYPVDTYDQVKTASEYFSGNWKQMRPMDRHQYCVKLASRMEEMGMAIPEDIGRYGSTTYAADVNAHLDSRKSLVEEEFLPALNALKEKRAHVSPETFVVALTEFDKIASINWHWDTLISDPWASTYGPSLEKVASLEWTWEKMGVRIHEEDLKDLALNGRHLLKRQFGEKFADEFAKSPKSVFNSLPEPNKLVLARLSCSRRDAAENF